MVQTLDSGSDSGDVVAALLQDGGVIVANQAADDVIDRILENLRGPFDEQGHKFQNDFNGYTTLRLGGILGLSRASADLIAHPRVMEVADAVLKRHCSNYRIGSTTAIEIHPGEDAQVLHRDDGFYPMRLPDVEFQISAMWALRDFTVENGATTGHIKYLQASRDLGDLLIVGINSDESVRRLKGPNRPVLGEEDRAHLLGALSCVDHVVVFEQDDPLELIRRVRPHVLTKGADYTVDKVVGHKEVGKWGGEVRLIPLMENRSTSGIIEKIAKRRR